MVTIADLDGNGRLDVVATTFNNSVMPSTFGVSVLLNNGDATFAAPVFYRTSDLIQGQVAAGDVNGDRRIDLVVTGSSLARFYVGVLMNNGDGTFAPSVQYPVASTPSAVTLADLNGDGINDLSVVFSDGLASHGLAVLLNHGDGTFAPATNHPAGLNPTSIASGDINGDGKPDLVVGSYASEVAGVQENLSVLLNEGDGNLAAAIEYPAADWLTSVAIGDLNGDGRDDLAVTNSNAQIWLLTNNGNGTFASPVVYSLDHSWGAIALGDVTGNGRNDIVATNSLAFGLQGWFGGNVSVLVNRGGGVFLTPIDFPEEAVEPGVALGDLDGDGKLDVVVVNHSYACTDSVSVLLNNSL